MKSVLFLSLLVLFYFNSFSQSNGCPSNIDFELGNFSNWTCYTGYTDTLNGQNVITFDSSFKSPVSGRHEIISANSYQLTDPYGNFPALCPYGGKYSVKLGNSSTNAQAEGLSYEFQIPTGIDTFALTYYYAVVFQDPGHTPIEQPRFFVTAYEKSTHNLINCASYSYIAQGNIPGFKSSLGDTTIKYKDWTPVSINFSGLAGKTVVLEFRTADCTRGGHFGYAYVDISSGCSATIAAATYCIGTNQVTLNAPYGFEQYVWYNDNYSTIVGSSQSVIISPPPPANAVFHIDMIPYVGYGCRDTADAKVEPVYPPDTPIARSEYYYCQNQYALPITASSDPGNQLLWYSSATGGLPNTSTPVPSAFNIDTTEYYVSQKQLFGCEGPRKKITVFVAPTPDALFSLNNYRQCENNNFVFLNTSTGTIPSTAYTWNFGDGDTSSQINAAHNYKGAGIYNVSLRAFNPPSCFTNYSQTVTIVPKPIASFDFPPLICEDAPPFIVTDKSYVPSNLGTLADWQWIINGISFSGQSPAPIATRSGNTNVKLVVKTVEGCKSDTTTITIPVRYKPIADFNSSNSLFCDNEITYLNDQSKFPTAAPSQEQVVKWYWQLDNVTSSDQDPSLIFNKGDRVVKLISESSYGCQSDQVQKTLHINPKPAIQLTINDSCVNRVVNYKVASLPGSNVTDWYWNLGGGYSHGTDTVTLTFPNKGDYPFRVYGLDVNGCKDTIMRPFRIYRNEAFAGNDTIVAIGQPVFLNANGGNNVDNYTWTPSDGLSNVTIENPVANLDRDQLYELRSISRQGCDSYSKVLIKRYKGPELYIPTAFTPNHDGINDVFKVLPVGIKVFYFFAVYDRYGKQVFYTTDYLKGWDGKINGIPASEGSYVFVCKVLDYNSVPILKKGNVLLIR
ncbi:PKD domain-containing protein [Ferruginibacter albus]|uniref:PKD domain-containing protein n=1 Tax=Ferruginibacter albus TaxID=2875540 RepID=UPI001CC772F5|nr:PKD domain-containing protein [Ferruginibacter albus]UAY52758.1 gliding motility-associated C-terminal domain-containing protein [Ferruginibacter albus]